VSPLHPEGIEGLDPPNFFHHITEAQVMAYNSNGQLFMMAGIVICLRNRQKREHPREIRPLAPGDIFRFTDAMNGNLYWIGHSGRTQSIPVDDVMIYKQESIEAQVDD
jgi:hypothetical protein